MSLKGKQYIFKMKLHTPNFSKNSQLIIYLIFKILKVIDDHALVENSFTIMWI